MRASGNRPEDVPGSPPATGTAYSITRPDGSAASDLKITLVLSGVQRRKCPDPVYWSVAEVDVLLAPPGLAAIR